MNAAAVAVRIQGVRHRYGSVAALTGIDLLLPAGGITGFVGPDGVGKSTLLALLAGARRLQEGHISVLGGDMARAAHRRQVCPRIAYNPQGLGRNLYATLSVRENLDYFGRLFGHGPKARAARIAETLSSTGLLPFAERAVGQLSGGMKQKLGLCCALIHDPDLLILDEPTTGVDPLSRRHFWELIDRIRGRHAGMTVLVSTAYMEEAGRFDRLVAMHAGQVLTLDTPAGVLERTHCTSLEEAFIALLPPERRQGHRQLMVPPRPTHGTSIAIEAHELSCRFGHFTAVDRVSFRIERGEIFGFLGSNGCGKTTTMKMLTGLLPATQGSVQLFGETLDASDMAVRRRVGYMSQNFALYRDLTVRQNLELQGRLFSLPQQRIAERIDALLDRFGLIEWAQALPLTLPLGHRQRLQLAAAVVHQPELLILDEPTSGVDPVARDNFWALMIDLSRREGVTIFVSTHFMNEAQRCDRVSLMHAGRVLASGTPTELAQAHGGSLENSFVARLQEAAAQELAAQGAAAMPASGPDSNLHAGASAKAVARTQRLFSPYRLLSCARRETLELLRDPIRLAMSLLGTVLLMVIIGYGISLDVKDLRYAVLDRDASVASRAYTLDLAGSPYFVEQAPVANDSELDRRMRSGKLSLAVEIPPGFGADLARGRPTAIGVWIDGAMPMRAEIISGYVQALHAGYVAQKLTGARPDAAPASVEVRYRYNPEVRSIVSMVPAVIPILLIFIPSMLAALAVVREKEMGSITNLYVTPVTKLEFLFGKQLPYVATGMVNFALLTLMAVTVFGVPFSGSLATFALAALLYVFASTSLGLLLSAFTRSQLAALFGTALATMLPAIQFSGIINPVSALEGLPALMGQLYPTAPFVTISRGTFSKGLGFADLHALFVPLALAGPLLLAVSVLLLRKQER